MDAPPAAHRVSPPPSLRPGGVGKRGSGPVPPPVRIPLKLPGRPPAGYDILVGRGLLARLGRAVRARSIGASPLVITHPGLRASFGRTLVRSCSVAGLTPPVFLEVPPGEGSKSLAAYGRLVAKVLAHTGSERADPFLVALGGGVVGDLAGFVAATVRRGLPYVQVPTSLVAFVDSGVGGKVGLNAPAGRLLVKNAIGAFHQPALVLGDVATLATLPRRELRSGLAEVVKYGILRDPFLLARLERSADRVLRADPGALLPIIERSYRIKARYVEADERDVLGIRAQLNLGHTFGHALEAVSRFGYRHGEAVAIGLAAACDLGVALLGMPREEAERVERLLERMGLPVRYRGASPAQIRARMAHDKKAKGGRLRFVVPERLGRARLLEGIPEGLLERILEERASR